MLMALSLYSLGRAVNGRGGGGGGGEKGKSALRRPLSRTESL